ncbi:MAG: AbrB family transcriptional regulator [Hyphomicrobiaceae bacterium]|nr:AbrB family transcriptional regulator [Hyphomicrobiaceae bacterium]
MIPTLRQDFWISSLKGWVIGCVGALAFVTIGLPLPWFLGAMTATLLAAVGDVKFRAPSGIANTVRAILGVAIGSAFGPEILSRAGPMLLSLSLMVPWVFMVLGLGVAVFMRLFAFDPKTAFFASVPGGLTDMVTLAEEAGANVRSVTLVQLTRIALLVFALPIYLHWHDGFDVSRSAFIAKARLSDMTLQTSLELLIMGIAGFLGARQLGIAGASIVGPMILSGLLFAIGSTTARMPFEAMTLAQVALGILLGAQFRGLTLKEFRTTVAAGLIFTTLLLLMTLAWAALVEQVSGFSGAKVLMSFAPGGQAEINLLAFALGIDVAFVALHHLVRLAVVMGLAQLLSQKFKL